MIIAVMGEWLGPGEELPQDNTKAVHVALLIEGSELHDFWCHPKGLFISNKGENLDKIQKYKHKCY
jgi:hypothetical protein